MFQLIKARLEPAVWVRVEGYFRLLKVHVLLFAVPINQYGTILIDPIDPNDIRKIFKALNYHCYKMFTAENKVFY